MRVLRPGEITMTRRTPGRRPEVDRPGGRALAEKMLGLTARCGRCAGTGFDPASRLAGRVSEPIRSRGPGARHRVRLLPRPGALQPEDGGLASARSPVRPRRQLGSCRSAPVEHGIWVTARGVWYVSASHGDEELEAVLTRFELALTCRDRSGQPRGPGRGSGTSRVPLPSFVRCGSGASGRGSLLVADRLEDVLGHHLVLFDVAVPGAAAGVGLTCREGEDLRHCQARRSPERAGVILGR